MVINPYITKSKPATLMDDVNISGLPLEMSFEVQEMPPDGSECLRCKQPIYGKMFRYFLFNGNTDPMPTKFKYCEPCFNKEE